MLSVQRTWSQAARNAHAPACPSRRQRNFFTNQVLANLDTGTVTSYRSLVVGRPLDSPQDAITRRSDKTTSAQKQSRTRISVASSHHLAVTDAISNGQTLHIGHAPAGSGRLVSPTAPGCASAVFLSVLVQDHGTNTEG